MWTLRVDPSNKKKIFYEGPDGVVYKTLVEMPPNFAYTRIQGTIQWFHLNEPSRLFKTKEQVPNYDPTNVRNTHVPLLRKLGLWKKKKKKKSKSKPAEQVAATSSVVARHYNELDRTTNRTLSSAYQLRSLNNFIKIVLLKTSSPLGPTLDLCCGKLGDFKKCLFEAATSYTGIDIAAQSLREGVARLPNTNTVPVTLIHADATDFVLFEKPTIVYRNGHWQTTEERLDIGPFQTVSIQFALHYLKPNLASLMRFISSKLLDGGSFLCTFPDASRVYDLATSGVDCVRDAAQREVCRVELIDNTAYRNTAYRMRLTEYIQDSHIQDSHIQDSHSMRSQSYIDGTEWFLPIHMLINHAAKFDLKLVFSHNFQEFFRQQANNHVDLLKKMRLTNLDRHSWTIAGLYRVAKFVKSPHTHRIVLIVPYRQRAEHLAQFVPYMTRFLSQSLKPFHIYVVEQSDDGRLFNRGRLLNIGYKLAEKNEYSTIIFHDVDLLPAMEMVGSYASPLRRPRHIASCWGRYNSNRNYIGGVTAFRCCDFERINGFPASFWGWGGEDDALKQRCDTMNMHVNRVRVGSYTDLEGDLTAPQKLSQLRHHNELNMRKYENLAADKVCWREDGLNSSTYQLLDTRVADCCTHITVQLT